MKVALVFNKDVVKDSDVIRKFGMSTKETYKPNTIEAVEAGLLSGGHTVRTIVGNKQVIAELEEFMPDMIFNMAYGVQGQSRYTHIPAILEMIGLPYLGSGPTEHALALDKVLAKIVFRYYGLPTPDFWVFSNGANDYSKVRYPAIVKPKMEAISSGIQVVYNVIDLEHTVRNIVFEFEQDALVESFIPGREFAVSLLGNGSTLEALPVVEIDLDNDPHAIQSLDDKMSRPRGKICPALLDKATEERLKELSKDAFNALELSDFARVDFRMDAIGNLYILEINSMASLNLTGSYVYSGKIAGMDFNALVNRMLDVAHDRYFGNKCEAAKS